MALVLAAGCAQVLNLGTYYASLRRNLQRLRLTLGPCNMEAALTHLASIPKEGFGLAGFVQIPTGTSYDRFLRWEMVKMEFSGKKVTGTLDANNVTPSASETSKKKLPSKV